MSKGTMDEMRSPHALPFRTLPEALFAAPPDNPFVTMWKSEDEIRSATFGEFKQQALRQAGYLRSQGVRTGDTVILIMPQGIPLMAAFMGAMILGAIPAILAYPNFKIEPAKYRFGLKGVTANLKARLILVDQGFPDELMHHVSVEGTARLVRCEDEGSSTAAPDVSHEVDPEQVAFIQHSAGTTGLQKGVALSHKAVLTQISLLSQALRIGADDRIYSWLPLYHDMGLIACFMLPLVCHTPLVMQSPTDWVMQPAAMLELISSYRCSLAWIPNFTLQFLARRVRTEDRSTFDLSCLRALINCSEPVRAASMDEFLAAYPGAGLKPTVLQSCYAMAETVFAVTQSDVTEAGPRRIWVDGDAFRKQKRALPISKDTPGAVCLVSSGSCLPNTQIRVVSEEGKELGPGGVGEIVIHCDSMLDGYYNRPDLTAKTLRDGWYWSGDLGFHLDGELYVIGRKKDLIIVAGENIYPQDVEEIVSAHPAIYDGRVVAFGQYNPTLGTEEIVVVAEVRKEDDLQNGSRIDRALRTAITSELGVGVGPIYLKPPRWIVKSTAGKPARSTTREKLVSEHAELRVQGELA
jgi:acyl-CoA synthetase (AMP-forming)/AMP-acid ligase II